MLSVSSSSSWFQCLKLLHECVACVYDGWNCNNLYLSHMGMDSTPEMFCNNILRCSFGYILCFGDCNIKGKTFFFFAINYHCCLMYCGNFSAVLSVIFVILKCGNFIWDTRTKCLVEWMNGSKFVCEENWLNVLIKGFGEFLFFLAWEDKDQASIKN